MPWVESDSPEASQAPPGGGRWVESDAPEVTGAPQPGLSDKIAALGKQYLHLQALGPRAAIQGAPAAVMGLPALAMDAVDSLRNLGVMGQNALPESLGIPKATPIPVWQHSKAVSDLGVKLADLVGLPQPQGKIEQGATDIASAAVSALGGAGLAGKLASLFKGAPGRAGAAFNELAQGPGIQAIGAAGGAAAPLAAREAGVTDPRALMLIGALGGVGSGAMGTLGERLAGGAAQMAAPFTNAGRQVIVGKALNRVATNPSQAADTLANAAEIVPGSLPTVSQAARDPGLAGAESVLRGQDTRNLIGQRQSEQNRARQEELYKVAGDETTVATAKANQKAAYDELAVPAFKAKTPVNIGRDWIDNPVLRTIQGIRGTPAGARQTVQNAMDHAQEMLTQPGINISDPETLYSIRKDLALARDGKLVGKGKSGIELANLKTARAQLNTVIDSLDDVIETGAPGFKNYLSVFAERSLPLDQLKAAQALRQRAENAILDNNDPGGAIPVLSNRFGKIFRDNLDNGLNLRGRGPKAGNLSQNQLETVQRVADDIDRGASAQAATVKVPGSDTFKNLSVGSIIGRILGDQTGSLVADSSAVKTAVRPLSFIYRMPDEAIQQMVIEAWLDPKLASRLMKQATQHEVDSMAAELKDRFSKQMTAQAIYGARP